MDISVTDRVIQTEVDQTASIVYETAKKAVETDKDVYEVGLCHEEDEHFNLGRTQEWIPGIDRDLQFRRFGGGDYVMHDNTYCFMEARVKPSAKEQVALERDRIAMKTLEAMNELYQNVGIKQGPYIMDLNGNRIEDSENALYYDQDKGDIFQQKNPLPNHKDPKVAGIGIADMQEKFGDTNQKQNVVIGRVCMYPDQPGENAVKLDRHARKSLEQVEDYRDTPLTERVETVEVEQIAPLLEEDGSKTEADNFTTPESVLAGEKLQEINGKRPAKPCL